jgi:hypothetical protein
MVPQCTNAAVSTLLADAVLVSAFYLPNLIMTLVNTAVGPGTVMMPFWALTIVLNSYATCTSAKSLNAHPDMEMFE